MAGFPTFDSILNAGTTAGRSQSLFFDKLMPSVSVAGVPYSWWSATGIPSAGTFPAAGMASAITQNSSTTGAIPFTNASGGRTMHLISGAMKSSVIQGYMLVDRLASATITNDQATASFSPVIDGTARLETGEGAMIFCEVTSALSAAANTRTFTYTNQAGTGSRTTQNMVTAASAVVRRVPYSGNASNAQFFVGLQTGDTGVRSIESTTLSAGTATGEFNIALVKPICLFPFPATNQTYDFDFIWSNFALPRIKDGACLQIIAVPNTTTIGNIFGQLTIVEN